ncbi:MAG: hypothetical protein PUF12_08040 [Thermoflexaceae bacterium]|nr:hypothetical protein [Thermoflexaceae bacterium]
MKAVEWIKENSITLSLAVFSIIYVTICSLFFDVGLTPDSTNYLREANALLCGYGLNNHAGAGYDGFYGIWPIGYSALIALVSFVTRLEVFYAAKLITIGIYIITTMMFIRRFGKNAWVYLLFFCNSGYIYCMRYVSSENLYLFAMLWFSFCCYDVWTGEEKENKSCILLGLSSLFAILSRWVGAFTLAITGLMAFLYFFGITVEKSRKKSFKLLGITAVNAGVLLTYLAYIKQMTGYTTGMYRIPSEESRLELLYMLIKAENMEIYDAVMGLFSVNNVISVGIWIGVFVFFTRQIVKDRFKDKFAPAFILSSVVYWCGYVYTRFQTDMEIFNYRVLLPATLPLLVAITYYLMQNDRVSGFVESIYDSRMKRAIVVLVLFILSFELHNRCKILGIPYDAYGAIKNHVEQEYRDVPSGSLVITEDWDINFLRMDLKRCSVNDCDSDSLDDIIADMNNEEYSHVYLQKAYLEYLLYEQEDDESYSELRKYLNSDGYLIRLR